MSRVLLDTHLLLWWLKDDPRLPTSLVTELQAGQHSVLISQASLWEMAIKVNLGRLNVDLKGLEQRVPAEGFQWLPISNEHLLQWPNWKPSRGIVTPLIVCLWPNAGLNRCCCSPVIEHYQPMETACA